MSSTVTCIGIRPLRTSELRSLWLIDPNSDIDITARTDLISDPDIQIFEGSNSIESFFIFHIYHEKSNRDVNKPFLLLGDLNYHHPWWNPIIQSPSPQATELHDYLREKRERFLLDPEVIEEFGGIFHRSNSRSTSVIDLAFVAGFQTIQWDHWCYGESTGSDHEIILFQSSKFTPPSPSEQGPCLPPRFNIKRAN
ncbi:hypothetical protein K3495_g784 [Podosphaera aphanis]|nr:hypothetical protein K3495_g784 [Podosphaera aphanis]